MKATFLGLALLMASIWQTPAAIIARNGVARTVIVVDPSATESHAREVLATRAILMDRGLGSRASVNRVMTPVLS